MKLPANPSKAAAPPLLDHKRTHARRTIKDFLPVDEMVDDQARKVTRDRIDPMHSAGRRELVAGRTMLTPRSTSVAVE